MVLDSMDSLSGLFLLMVLQVLIPPIPAELVVIFSGKYYGVIVSSLVAGSGLYFGSVLVYFIGIYINQKFNFFFRRDKICRVLEAFKRYQRFILWIRLLPYNPSDIIAYVAGIARIKRSSFLTICFCTSYIRCFLLSWMGDQIIGWKSISISFSILIISAFFTYSFLFKKK